MHLRDRFEYATAQDPALNYCLWDYPSPAPAEDKSIRYAQLLRAQQGFRGRNAQQGWTISD